MTVARTIQIAEQHAARGDVPAACRILDFAIRTAISARSQWKLDVTVARSIRVEA